MHGYAFAGVVAGFKARTPDELVTHNWAIKFSHLLGALIADDCGVSSTEDLRTCQWLENSRS